MPDDWENARRACMAQVLDEIRTQQRENPQTVKTWERVAVMLDELVGKLHNTGSLIKKSCRAEFNATCDLAEQARGALRPLLDLHYEAELADCERRNTTEEI